MINFVNASPLLEGAEVNEEMNVVSKNQTYSLALVDMIGTLDDLGTFAMETIESIGAQRFQPLCHNLFKFMVNMIKGIEAMTAERDSSNEAAEENLLPVFPGTANVESSLLILKWKKVMEGLHYLSLHCRESCMQSSTNK